jgi:hypothetical protein
LINGGDIEAVLGEEHGVAPLTFSEAEDPPRRKLADPTE